MKMSYLLLLIVALLSNSAVAEQTAGKISLVIHGGAGTILKKDMTAEQEEEYKAQLSAALEYGYKVLKEGGSSVDAVKATLVILEDSPLFNAGKGAVFTHQGTNELDASIMSGKDLSAGAVAGVSHIKNPILLADKVRTNSEHVMMAREGAEQFAKEQGFTFVNQEYFFTEKRWLQLKDAQSKQGKLMPSIDQKYGTVGAVALDSEGYIAAGTSTGGMTNKRYARVGDSPVIGAGTYANKACGISSTGHGEYFIRAAVAHDICALAEYAKLPLQEAADIVIHHKLHQLGGTGGVVGLDAQGNIMMSFNTPGMYRGSIDHTGKIIVQIYK